MHTKINFQNKFKYTFDYTLDYSLDYTFYYKGNYHSFDDQPALEYFDDTKIWIKK
jgi:hypothetical protein